jgi:hypothetical protein
VAVREVQTAYREIDARYESMIAAAGEVEYITERWKYLPNEDRSAGLLLEDLLAAQDRLTLQEFDFLSAEVDYNLALIALRRATGTLLQLEDVTITRLEEEGIPQLLLDKAQPVPAGTPPAGVPGL